MAGKGFLPFLLGQMQRLRRQGPIGIGAEKLFLQAACARCMIFGDLLAP